MRLRCNRHCCLVFGIHLLTCKCGWHYAERACTVAMHLSPTLLTGTGGPLGCCNTLQTCSAFTKHIAQVLPASLSCEKGAQAHGNLRTGAIIQEQSGQAGYTLVRASTEHRTSYLRLQEWHGGIAKGCQRRSGALLSTQSLLAKGRKKGQP